MIKEHFEGTTLKRNVALKFSPHIKRIRKKKATVNFTLSASCIGPSDLGPTFRNNCGTLRNH